MVIRARGSARIQRTRSQLVSKPGDPRSASLLEADPLSEPRGGWSGTGCDQGPISHNAGGNPEGLPWPQRGIRTDRPGNRQAQAQRLVSAVVLREDAPAPPTSSASWWASRSVQIQLQRVSRSRHERSGEGLRRRRWMECRGGPVSASSDPSQAGMFDQGGARRADGMFIA